MYEEGEVEGRDLPALWIFVLVSTIPVNLAENLTTLYPYIPLEEKWGGGGFFGGGEQGEDVHLADGFVRPHSDSQKETVFS